MKKALNITFTLILLALISGNGFSQIANIERSRMQTDTTGWAGSAGAAVSLTRNTVQVFAGNIEAQLQYKSKRSLYLILGSYGLLKASDSRLIDNGFLHLRYNYKINKVLRWELFTQWQNNKVTYIRYRVLAGTGPRFKMLSSQKLSLYAASLVMYEQEKEIIAGGLLHKDYRSSSYFSFTYSPASSVELVSTTFFQPLLKDFKDYRILNQAVLRLKTGKRLAVKINWDYLFDSRPAAGIPSENYTLSTGIDYDL